MQHATVGDFSLRLDMLGVCRALLSVAPAPSDGVGQPADPGAPRRRVLLRVLGHLVRYYSQFSAAVEGKLKAARQPLEQQMKDQVPAGLI